MVEPLEKRRFIEGVELVPEDRRKTDETRSSRQRIPEFSACGKGGRTRGHDFQMGKQIGPDFQNHARVLQLMHLVEDDHRAGAIAVEKLGIDILSRVIGRSQLTKTIRSSPRLFANVVFPARRTPASQQIGASRQAFSMRLSQKGLDIMEAYLSYFRSRYQVRNQDDFPDRGWGWPRRSPAPELPFEEIIVAVVEYRGGIMID